MPEKKSGNYLLNLKKMEVLENFIFKDRYKTFFVIYPRSLSKSTIINKDKTTSDSSLSSISINRSS